MSNTKTTAGILSMATYIPRAYHDADYIASQCDTPAEIIRTKLGWYQKNVPGPGDGTVAMGLKAARKALYYSGLEPGQIDLVIYSGEEVKEYRNWPVGPKIQKELDLKKAWSFDIQQRCGTTLVALKLARDMIRADESLRNILIVSSYRNSDLIHYPNGRVRWMYYLAAGGAACIVQRDCPKNEIINGHFLSDGSFAFDVYVPQGGSAEPMTVEGLKEGKQYLDVLDPVGMKGQARAAEPEQLACLHRQSPGQVRLYKGRCGLSGHIAGETKRPRLSHEGVGPETGADPVSGRIRPSRAE